MAQSVVHTGHTGIEVTDIAIGVTVAVGVHAFLAIALWMAPPAVHKKAAPARAEDGCTSVVSPACVGARPLVVGQARREKAEIVEDRRCPDPIRRLQRREQEPAPAVAVDILQAQLVAGLGSTIGGDIKELPVKTNQIPMLPAKPKVTDAFFGDSKLGDIVRTDDQAGAARKKRLGDLIGLRDGQMSGEGNVNQSGSVYWRDVGRTVKEHFELPPSVPVWERAGLRAKVRITRMTASGTILNWSWDKKSGNDEFDKAVGALITSYKSGMRSLPRPSGDALAEINSRGGVIELRGGH